MIMRVGIITMHRVLNCGSALQAYALQHIIEKLGHHVELIDYVYPNTYHKKTARMRCKQQNKLFFLLETIYGFFYALIVKRMFTPFYNRFFNLSRTTYKTKKQIHSNPPKYDFYISGSDQIWNPIYIGRDTTFMLTFTNDKSKISYSSSIANSNIPQDCIQLYSDALKEFKAISVREEQSCNLVRSLTGKDVKFVLDPTLLLDGDQWEDVLNFADITIDERYILVYVLGYSFDVNDYAAEVINYLQKKTGLKVVVLAYTRKKRNKLNNFISINRIIPANFLSLIKNATLVVTDSFHASAMSVNFSRPLYSLIKERSSSDNRVYSFLRSVGADSRAVELSTPLDDLPSLEMDYTEVNLNLILKRKESLDFLKCSLR